MDQMPAFRRPQVDRRVEDALYHLRSQVTSQILGAYTDGFTDGEARQRRLLIERLREYEKDSVVAKLLAELLQKEVEQT